MNSIFPSSFSTIIDNEGEKQLFLTQETNRGEVHIMSSCNLDIHINDNTLSSLCLRIENETNQDVSITLHAAHSATIEIRVFVSSTSNSNKHINFTVLSSEKSHITISILGIADETSSQSLSLKPFIRPEDKESSIHTHIEGVLLNKKSSIFALPLLDIHTNTIKEASHSCVFSFHDEESLFYLESKGIQNPKDFIQEEKKASFLSFIGKDLTMIEFPKE